MIRVLDLGEYVVIRLQNPLNAYANGILEEQLRAIASTPLRLWVIDLAEVDFIDSVGVTVLVSAFKLARRHGCRLTLCNPSSTVKLVLEITQLDQALEIVEESTFLSSYPVEPQLSA
ncbi:MAG: STAS domain-containing protein [Microcoleaceae cyanobacterium]